MDYVIKKSSELTKEELKENEIIRENLIALIKMRIESVNRSIEEGYKIGLRVEIETVPLNSDSEVIWSKIQWTGYEV